MWRGRRGCRVFSGSYCNSKPKKCVCQLGTELRVSMGFYDCQYSQHLTLATPLCCKVMSGYVGLSVRQATLLWMLRSQPGNLRELSVWEGGGGGDNFLQYFEFVLQ